MEGNSGLSAAGTPRLRSVDALRGFDMLWIVGLAALFRELAATAEAPWLEAVAWQLHHAEWAGLRAYDLIFPLFMFLAGMSIPYAITARISRGVSRWKIVASILRRVVLLVVLGAVYNGLLRFDFDDQRYASVLGQIGIAYGIAALVYLATKGWAGRMTVCVLILVGVAALQLFVPVPGYAPGTFTPHGIINGWIDRRYLPGRLHGEVFDPEGWLCIVSAAALTLAGVMTGEYVKLRGSRPHFRSLLALALAGSASFGLGWLAWYAGYPPIKAAWTTTFNLLAGGICVWLFAIFHLLVDGLPRFDWSFPLRVVGMNPLTIYLLHRFVPFGEISAGIFGGAAALAGKWEAAIVIGGMLLIEWLLLLFLWRKRVFLRL